MDVKTKAVVCVLPFAIAGYLGFSMAAPAWDEFNQKSQAVDDKKRENQELQLKLSESAKLDQQKRHVEDMIQKLRSAVPKLPEMELLNIDIEKMCLDSGLDVTFFGKAEANEMQRFGIDIKGEETPVDQVPQSPLKKLAPKAAGEKPTAAPATPEKPVSKEAMAGLAKRIVLVKALGDFPALMEFVRKIESYQRVLGIINVHAHIPKKPTGAALRELPDDTPAKDDEPQGDPKRLYIRFVLTAYYLP